MRMPRAFGTRQHVGFAPMRARTALISILAAACGGAPAAPPAPPTQVAAAPAVATAAAPAPAPAPRATDYPATRRVDVVDDVHGVRIPDAYRWLEDAKDPAVQSWIDGQDVYARRHLEALPGREALRKRFVELSYYDSVGAPQHHGKRFFYTRKHADKEKAIVYWREGDQGAEHVLLDPNALSTDGSVALGGYSPSWDGRYVAYKLKQNNSDKGVLHVLEVATGKDLPIDTIEGGRYAYASWTHDGKGFYYSWLPTDPSIPESELPGKAEIRYHRLGTDPAGDTVVKAALNDPTSFQSVGVSEDGRWLVHSVGRGWWANDLYVRDLKNRNQTELVPLITGKDALYQAIPWKNAFYVYTNEGAPRWRIFKVDPRKPARDAWREIVPERDATLDTVEIVGGHLLLGYKRNATSQLELLGLDGKPVRTIALPGLGTVTSVAGRADEDDVYYGFESYTQVPQIYRASIKTGATGLWAEIKLPIDAASMVAEQVWYPSRDGTKVSMFLIHRKDLARDGTTPTLLTGYGGFASDMAPAFEARNVVWLEHGGAVAIPNLRGGGEYGEEWHKAGMLDRKQNVFDDFIGAAQWLIDQKITSSERLAIAGRSNGGLLVGAAMTQRPDLFRAVICGVPLLDMVRYTMFGAGKTWVSEYGTAEDAKQFPYLHAYSPYHRIVDGTRYPALLMTSVDSDDRVDPMHARKFTAAIQRATTSGRPVWMRVDRNAGHGGGDMVQKTVDLAVDTYAFLLAELGAP